MNFEIQTDHPIQTRRPDLASIKKRTRQQVDFAVSANYRRKMKENWINTRNLPENWTNFGT